VDALWFREGEKPKTRSFKFEIEISTQNSKYYVKLFAS
jgi:hypothetical protein